MTFLFIDSNASLADLIRNGIETKSCAIIIPFLENIRLIPVAYLLAMKDFKGKEILDTLVDLPISMPPLVAGLALLILLGGDSKFGGMLSNHGRSSII